MALADDVVANAGAGGATFRTFSDGTREWPANVVAFVATEAPGANVLQSVNATNGLPVKQVAANTNWAQALSLVSGATATVVNIASSVTGYQIKGMICHGTGDGYFFIQVGGVTVISGRTRSTAPMLSLVLLNGIPVTTGSVVALKVTNESGSTADYEVTLLGG